MAKVGIVMGSDSDMPVMAQAADFLEKMGIEFEMTVIHLYSGKAKFKIYSPDGLFPEREFELELVSGIVQPEANTYMLKAHPFPSLWQEPNTLFMLRHYYD